ncbi:beta-barrel assembly-enhancing protease [Novipirellula caenicola]|uniref:Beta-barrel assembly-enhancing protease n=2 Tax=Novipirellula caenicola TaxID=1536901 RepID=A0ABP9VPA3_9BACT
MSAHRFKLVMLLCVALGAVPAIANDLESAQNQFRTGKYKAAEAVAFAAVESGIWNERWPRLLIQCQLEQGKYAEALQTYDTAIRRYPTSMTLRLLGLEAIRFNNLSERSEEERKRFFQLLQSSPLRFASRDSLIAAGRYFVDEGEDARQVLEMFYDRVRDSNPDFLEAYIATAELALEKGDYKVAAETLAEAERIDDTDPRTSYLKARAFESSDAKVTAAALQQALELNPNHIPSLLMLAELALDRELYDDAKSSIAQVLKINPSEPDAWALQSVIAHLEGDPKREQEMRRKALSTWHENPRVDYLIGSKLSQKYRFAEGAAYQRRALEFDPDYHAANFQLAQDLLRLGNDDKGWTLAKSVAEDDPYNVVAHNLLTLHDRIKDFSILEAGDIHVRMDPEEADVYGEAVLELLTEARATLCEKYDVQPDAPIMVEIFPEQKDFAIRTFGLPGGAGYLGVCFGRVITANSPASQGERPHNWKSVLWHEFCHVVTLEKTKNRMPRWLSEGISVYEERMRNPTWGESMTPQYREMILNESLTPVSKLSSAFLSPPSALHLQFAYYESSLVIEFLIEKHGIESLKMALVSLGDGLSIDDALTRSVGSLDRLDVEFATYAREKAEAFAPDADWSREELPTETTTTELAKWVDEHPENYWGLRSLAEAWITEKQDEKALPLLEKIVELGAVTPERDGPLELLADVYQRLGRAKREREIREQVLAISSDALPSYRRLIEIATEQNEWQQVLEYSEQMLAIQPLQPFGYQHMATAAEQLKRPEKEVRPLKTLLQMDPIDPAALNFRLARAGFETGDTALAKRHVLAALEDAPRYRDAHRLLLEIVESER